MTSDDLTNLPFGINTIKRHKQNEGEPVVLCLCKDETYYIDKFLNHYRNLGVSNFCFLDNGSTDGTIEKLEEENDVTLLSSSWPYKIHQDDFKRTLISLFGKNRWSLLVDADEFLCIPYGHNISFMDFLSYLDSKNYNVVFTPMLDMFSADFLGALDRNKFISFNPKNYPLCSISTIRKPFLSNKIWARINRGYSRYYGGIREHLFGVGCSLHKFSLTRHTNEMPLYRTPHHIFENRSKVANISAAIQHYKFTSNFRKKIDDALQNNQYFENSSEYRQYNEFSLQDNPLILNIPSIKFTNLEELYTQGFGFNKTSNFGYMENKSPNDEI